MSESHRCTIADTTLRQQKENITPDDTIPVLEQQSSLPQQQPSKTISRETPQQQQQEQQHQALTEIGTPKYNNQDNSTTATTMNSTTRTAGNIKGIGNECEISYEAEAKQILPHSPILNGMKGNIINSSNQLQQQSALHNQPSLQANVNNNINQSQRQRHNNYKIQRNKLSLEIQHNNKSHNNYDKFNATMITATNYAHINCNERITTSSTFYEQQQNNNKSPTAKGLSTHCEPLVANVDTPRTSLH
ncbi:probable serine/threonine-protein kinase DDB_G0282963 [Glossina fuscipes]|uniref:Probable serine/threonine-protein kinase DDB_G0282963 n=1 Tax=Glossina fuscipes TaxID=7396 RepID=A0A9C6DZ91_9MUSC|nr:probable serine/threonine-protein kinase DDB_G0282963 [Glossina fuscipes]